MPILVYSLIILHQSHAQHLSGQDLVTLGNEAIYLLPALGIVRKVLGENVGLSLIRN